MENKLEENLNYVRDAIERQARPVSLAAAFNWAIYLIVGLTALDLRLSWAPWFMLFGMPIALGIDAFAERRARQREGILGSREHAFDLWSSLAFVLAYFIVIGFSMAGHIPWQSLNSIIALIVGLHLYNGGLSMQRKLKPVFSRVMALGLLYMAAAIAMMFQSQWVWTSLAWVTAGILFSLTAPFATKREAIDA